MAQFKVIGVDRVSKRRRVRIYTADNDECAIKCALAEGMDKDSFRVIPLSPLPGEPMTQSRGWLSIPATVGKAMLGGLFFIVMSLRDSLPGTKKFIRQPGAAGR